MKQRGMGCATQGGGACAVVGKKKKSPKKMKYGGSVCKRKK
jgi:hypothetical protein